MPNDRLVATALAERHGLQRDREHAPFYAYRSGTHWTQGWYEDTRSRTRKSIGIPRQLMRCFASMLA